jgi:hypothetical protein
LLLFIMIDIMIITIILIIELLLITAIILIINIMIICLLVVLLCYCACWGRSSFNVDNVRFVKIMGGHCQTHRCVVRRCCTGGTWYPAAALVLNMCCGFARLAGWMRDWHCVELRCWGIGSLEGCWVPLCSVPHLVHDMVPLHREGVRRAALTNSASQLTYVTFTDSCYLLLVLFIMCRRW